MPVRNQALPPGAFIASHMQEVGGVDYCQATYKAYKTYLENQGIKKIPSREAMSKYFWLARKMGLIVFDHAESAAYWNAQVNYPRITVRYRPEPRPRAPSPRHYYRIIDAQDPRWYRIEASYRQSIGIEVNPPFPTVPYIPLPAQYPISPEEMAARLALPAGVPVEEVTEVAAAPMAPVAGVPVPEQPKKKAKSKARPGVKPVPAQTADEAAKPFEDRLKVMIQTLDQFKKVYEAQSALANIQVASALENELLSIGSDLIPAIRKKQGAVRDRLDGISNIIQQTVNDIGLLRSNLSNYNSATLSGPRATAKVALDTSIRVIREDLSGEVPEE